MTNHNTLKYLPFAIFFIFILYMPSQSLAGNPSESTLMQTERNGWVRDSDNSYTRYDETQSELGMFLPDARGNYIWSSAGKRPPLNSNLMEAEELKLKVRELASQLLDVFPGESLQGLVAMPTSFVALNNFNETSPLGQYFAEALFYEFNLRGFPTKEYRLNGSIQFTQDGEFALTRSLPKLNYDKPWAALVVGTYYRDKHALFINARLVRPDGLVLRTAELILPINGIVDRMTRNPQLTTGSIAIKGR